MWVIEDIRWTATVLLALTGLMVVALGGPLWVPATEDDWLGAMMQAVLAEQAAELARQLEPYHLQYVVTPATYHDISRHIENFRKHQFEGLMGTVG